MRKVVIPISFILGCVTSEGYAQKVTLKSNLLYDATTTMNLGLEIELTRKWTLDILVNYSPWKPSNDKRLRHWGVQPEVRCWSCENFHRTFIGMHGHYADFNVGGWPNWSSIDNSIQRTRYREYLYDGGFSVEYLWILKKRWSIEASVGVGYMHIVYDRYLYATCGMRLKESSRSCLGPTKVSVPLIYIVK